uniref:J domain-containing protein n=1 Tax=Leptobrachium leishanense TaxID=445787 RepID=A0A8C5WBE0_9ANUR
RIQQITTPILLSDRAAHGILPTLLVTLLFLVHSRWWELLPLFSVEKKKVEQILAEYKVRALECHPDKQPGNLKAVETFQKLQQAKETLTNEASRAQYDYWRRSKIMIPYNQWEALQDCLKMSMHWAVKEQKEPMLEAPQTEPNMESEEMGSEIIYECDIPMKITDNIDLLSPKSPEGGPDMVRGLLHFRWSADTPSDLLRKFRNYEI